MIKTTSSDSSQSACVCGSWVMDGVEAGKFSSWTINGARDGNTDNCVIHMRTYSPPYSGFKMLIYGYSDAGHSIPVFGASTNSVGPTTITISQISGSGISGSVYWDGSDTASGTCDLTCT